MINDILRDWMLRSPAMLPDATPLTSIKKALQEIDELLSVFHRGDDFQILDEYADIILYITHSMAAHHFTVEHLEEALRSKTEINYRREWNKQPDGTYQHINKAT